MCVSDTHIVALTLEGLAYTWGEGKKGQLGHGELGHVFFSIIMCLKSILIVEGYVFSTF